MCIFAKKFWLGLALLPLLALASGGCASSRPAEPGYASREKAKKPSRTKVDEDVVIRGGFR